MITHIHTHMYLLLFMFLAEASSGPSTPTPSSTPVTPAPTDGKKFEQAGMGRNPAVNVYVPQCMVCCNFKPNVAAHVRKLRLRASIHLKPRRVISLKMFLQWCLPASPRDMRVNFDARMLSTRARKARRTMSLTTWRKAWENSRPRMMSSNMPNKRGSQRQRQKAKQKPRGSPKTLWLQRMMSRPLRKPACNQRRPPSLAKTTTRATSQRLR